MIERLIDRPMPDPAGLRRVESLENALEMFRINARAGIAHRHNQHHLGCDCSVLIDKFARPVSTELIASTALRIKFNTTCCN